MKYSKTCAPFRKRYCVIDRSPLPKLGCEERRKMVAIHTRTGTYAEKKAFQIFRQRFSETWCTDIFLRIYFKKTILKRRWKFLNQNTGNHWGGSVVSLIRMNIWNPKRTGCISFKNLRSDSKGDKESILCTFALRFRRAILLKIESISWGPVGWEKTGREKYFEKYQSQTCLIKKTFKVKLGSRLPKNKRRWNNKNEKDARDNLFSFPSLGFIFSVVPQEKLGTILRMQKMEAKATKSSSGICPKTDS